MEPILKEISFHLTNGETVISVVNANIDKYIQNSLDNNVQYLRIKTYYGKVLYINKAMILYIENNDQNYQYHEIKELIGDYIHENE